MVHHHTWLNAIGSLLSLWVCGIVGSGVTAHADGELTQDSKLEHRGPVDVVLAKDESWLVTANEASHSISLIDVSSGRLIDEQSCGLHPTAVAKCLDDSHVAVSCRDSGQVIVFEIRQRALIHRSTINVGHLPLGLAVSPDGKTAYVGLQATGELAQLRLEEGTVDRRMPVGPWPRYLALSPDGSRLAIGCSGDGRIVVVDTKTATIAFKRRLTSGINIGHLQTSNDGKYVYFPWMVYRSNPISVGNIQRGWVLASRIGRVHLNAPAPREAISLDVPRKAVADPHGLAISSDGQRLVVSASGTHELLVYRLPDLPFEGIGGPGDLIDPRLQSDKNRFARINVGGRPMGLVLKGDQKTALVANYLSDCVQVVDVTDRQIVAEIPLSQPQNTSLVQRGMALFYDGQRSLDQWYSCHTCHYNGTINSKAMDTLNDGSPLTMKTVLSLHDLQQTAPWTWHGWQTDLRDAMQKSFTTTMQGTEISESDTEAILTFLTSLKHPPNPFRKQNGAFTEAALRGKQIFESEQIGCVTCHQGEYFTDGQVHDLGLGSTADRYQGFNTPSLRGVYQKVRLLHDGRASSIHEVLTGDHAPEKVAADRPLTPKELSDLIEYVRSL